MTDKGMKCLAPVVYLLVIFALLVDISGCGAIAESVRYEMYESTREAGTRYSDGGKYTTKKIAKDVYRLTYTMDQEDFNSETSRKRLLAYASNVARKKGYKYYMPGGTGNTSREGIVMTKMLITCYHESDEDLPTGVITVPSGSE